MGRLPGGPQLLYFRDDVFFPPGLGSELLVDLVLKDRPECDELLLGEFPPPGGEETKPYHLNDLLPQPPGLGRLNRPIFLDRFLGLKNLL